MTNVTSLLVEAGGLMLIGMATVFVFLAILVLVVQLISRFAPPVASRTPEKAVSEPAVSAPVVAAIVAAVHQYRKNLK